MSEMKENNIIQDEREPLSILCNWEPSGIEFFEGRIRLVKHVYCKL